MLLVREHSLVERRRQNRDKGIWRPLEKSEERSLAVSLLSLFRLPGKACWELPLWACNSR